MLTKRIIPCLDLRDGRVVKGVRFTDLRDVGDPVTLARRYEQAGADELVILDISATREGRHASLETVRAVRDELSIALTVGGGMRTIDDAMATLRAGADKVSINSAAVESPTVLSELAARVGRQCVVLSLDAVRCDGQRHGWDVVTHSGRRRTGLDAETWARAAQKRGAGEVLLTSWDRDGTRSGYDLDLIRAIRDVVTLPIIASGGASGVNDMRDAFTAGADAALAASILHDNNITIPSARRELRAAGIEVRP